MADWAVFLLVGSKAATQLLANNFVGKWVDDVGSYTPLMTAVLGLTATSLVFVLGLVLVEINMIPTWVCYTVLIVARASQGIPSAMVMSAGYLLPLPPYPVSAFVTSSLTVPVRRHLSLCIRLCRSAFAPVSLLCHTLSTHLCFRLCLTLRH